MFETHCLVLADLCCNCSFHYNESVKTLYLSSAFKQNGMSYTGPVHKVDGRSL